MLQKWEQGEPENALLEIHKQMASQNLRIAFFEECHRYNPHEKTCLLLPREQLGSWSENKL